MKKGYARINDPFLNTGEARKEGLAGMEFADPRALVRSAKWTPAY